MSSHELAVICINVVGRSGTSPTSPPPPPPGLEEREQRQRQHHLFTSPHLQSFHSKLSSHRRTASWSMHSLIGIQVPVHHPSCPPRPSARLLRPPSLFLLHPLPLAHISTSHHYYRPPHLPAPSPSRLIAADVPCAAVLTKYAARQETAPHRSPLLTSRLTPTPTAPIIQLSAVAFISLSDRLLRMRMRSSRP